MIRRYYLLLIVGALIGLTAAAFALSGRQPMNQVQARLTGVVQSSAGFSTADGPRVFIFPADAGPHHDFQIEWWYYTGNLDSTDGRHFGYQLTFFRRAITNPAELVTRPSDWATNQVFMAHFALTDGSAEKFNSFERLERGAAGLAGAQAGRTAARPPYQVWVDDWQVTQTGPKSYHLQAAQAGLSIALDLTDDTGPVLQGNLGYSQKGPLPGNASYYYSLPHLTTSGQLTSQGKIYTVHGMSWMDHEFSTSALGPDEVGWDWFALQLNDGYELMVFTLRKTDGSLSEFSSGTLILPDGSTQHLAANDFKVTALHSWKSPQDGATYPSGWRLQVPSEGLELTISPYLADQENRLSFTYWEGAVKISGQHAGQSVNGEGYVELTGYAHPFRDDF